jgi:hypothetical protein
MMAAARPLFAREAPLAWSTRPTVSIEVYCFVPVHSPLYVPAYATPNAVVPVKVPALGWTKVLPENEIEQAVHTCRRWLRPFPGRRSG